jgi:AcrR family transcriptional regulator
MRKSRSFGVDGAPRETSRPHRTQRERREASDRRILAAAMTLIARNGAARSSMADIGLAAGYSRGLPGERFGTKVDLLKALVDSMNDWFSVRARAALEGKRGLEAVLARAAAHMDGAIDSPAATMALHSLYVESLNVIPELRAHMTTLTERYRMAFVKHLREGQRMGEIRPEINCSLQASIIIGAMRGLTHQAFTSGTGTDLRAAKPALLKTFADALRVP